MRYREGGQAHSPSSLPQPLSWYRTAACPIVSAQCPPAAPNRHWVGESMNASWGPWEERGGAGSVSCWKMWGKAPILTDAVSSYSVERGRAGGRAVGMPVTVREKRPRRGHPLKLRGVALLLYLYISTFSPKQNQGILQQQRWSDYIRIWRLIHVKVWKE